MRHRPFRAEMAARPIVRSMEYAFAFNTRLTDEHSEGDNGTPMPRDGSLTPRDLIHARVVRSFIRCCRASRLRTFWLVVTFRATLRIIEFGTPLNKLKSVPIEKWNPVSRVIFFPSFFKKT